MSSYNDNSVVPAPLFRSYAEGEFAQRTAGPNLARLGCPTRNLFSHPRFIKLFVEALHPGNSFPLLNAELLSLASL